MLLKGKMEVNRSQYTGRNSRCLRSGRSDALFFFKLFLAAFVALPAYGQQTEPVANVESLKKLSLEELMNLEVTSVSKRAEKITETSSAIQVITQEDIRHSGATSVP